MSLLIRIRESHTSIILDEIEISHSPLLASRGRFGHDNLRVLSPPV
jgi:hypothetical protein